MRKQLVFLTIFMLLMSTMTVRAQSEARYDEDLDDTEYTWILTIWDPAEDEEDDLEEGDEFTLVFDEAPGGQKVSDIESNDIAYQYNGEDRDVDDLTSQVDGMFFILLLVGIIADPEDYFDTVDADVNDGLATLEDASTSYDSEFIWDEDTGLLQSYAYDDDDGEFKLELDSGFFSFLSVNPLIFIFTLFAAPFILRKRR